METNKSLETNTSVEMNITLVFPLDANMPSEIFES